MSSNLGKKRTEVNIEVESWLTYSILKTIDKEQYVALCEFIDNSWQSFQDNKLRLKKERQKSVKVDVNLSPEKIIIEDNAGGIPQDRFDYAFRLAHPQEKDEESLNEFGMGMKAAAFWFGDTFTVKTSALGEDFSTLLTFDLKKIEKNKSDKLSGDQVKIEKAKKEEHYTIITITDLNRKPSRNDIFADHIKDTYRVGLRNAELEIYLKSKNTEREKISFEEPVWLDETFWDTTTGPYDGREKSGSSYLKTPKEFKNPNLLWKKEFEFEMPSPIDFARGYIGISKKMLKPWSGLVILRRNRAVFGTGKEDSNNSRYRPKEIFGPSGQQRYARIVGEITLGPKTKVTSSKRLNWEDEDAISLEPIFLERLKKVFNGDEKEFKKRLRKGSSPAELLEVLPIYKMAEKFRSENKKKLSKGVKEQQAVKAVTNTTAAIEKDAPQDVAEISDVNEGKINTPTKLNPLSEILFENSVELKYGKQIREVTVRVENEKKENWYEFAEDPKTKKIMVSITINHPFSEKFIIDKEGNVMNAMVRIAAGLALSEMLCKEGNNSDPAYMRVILNALLKGSLSKY